MARRFRVLPTAARRSPRVFPSSIGPVSGDPDASPGRSVLADARGLSYLEFIIAVSILGVVLGAALPTITSRPLGLAVDIQDFAANLQVARELAVSRSLHYRLRVVNTTQYVVERGQLNADGVTWSFPTVERALTLRPDVSFDATSVSPPLSAEFDTRGRLVGATEPIFTLDDSVRLWAKQVAVYTSGMVQKL